MVGRSRVRFAKTGSFPPPWAAVREATGIGFGDAEGGVAAVVVVVPAKSFARLFTSVFSSVTGGVSKTEGLTISDWASGGVTGGEGGNSGAKTVPRLAATMARTMSMPTRPIETLNALANAQEVSVVVDDLSFCAVVDDNGKISCVVAVCLGIFIMLLHKAKPKITSNARFGTVCRKAKNERRKPPSSYLLVLFWYGTKHGNLSRKTSMRKPEESSSRY